MELFDKRFVYFIWDPSLEGKKCFISDNISHLKYKVTNAMELREVEKCNNEDYPFKIYEFGMEQIFRFAYYDPNYEIKKAFNEGKKIQYKATDGNWYSLDDEGMLKWYIDEGCQLRVIPEEKKWIAYLARRKNKACYLTACEEDMWEIVQKEFGAKTKLFVGKYNEVNEWFEARNKFTKEIKAWEDGKEIQFRYPGYWMQATTPSWDLDAEFRVKEVKK